MSLNINAQTKWLKVKCGGEFTVALKSDGTLWSWGFNGNGQLGIGNKTTQYAPTQIGTDTDWIDVVAGGIHCLALKSDNSLWAWGFNNVGCLGDGTNIDKTSPVQIGSSNE